MRHPSSYLRRPDLSGSDSSTMTPMIDVVFQLLIFFVWTSSFTIIEQVLPSQMSAQTGRQQSRLDPPPPEEDFEKIVVRIGWDGSAPQFQINDAPVQELQDVRGHLDRLFQVKRDATIILHPDSIVPMEHVINVYDQAKQVNFEKVSFAVNPQSLPE